MSKYKIEVWDKFTGKSEKCSYFCKTGRSLHIIDNNAFIFFRPNNVVFDSAPLAPLRENMTSSTKTVRRTEPWLVNMYRKYCAVWIVTLIIYVYFNYHTSICQSTELSGSLLSQRHRMLLATNNRGKLSQVFTCYLTQKCHFGDYSQPVT